MEVSTLYCSCFSVFRASKKPNSWRINHFHTVNIVQTKEKNRDREREKELKEFFHCSWKCADLSVQAFSPFTLNLNLIKAHFNNRMDGFGDSKALKRVISGCFIRPCPIHIPRMISHYQLYFRVS